LSYGMGEKGVRRRGGGKQEKDGKGREERVVRGRKEREVKGGVRR